MQKNNYIGRKFNKQIFAQNDFCKYFANHESYYDMQYTKNCALKNSKNIMFMLG